MKTTRKLSFQVLSIDCVVCTPVFKREIEKLRGVNSVRPLVMLNKIIVEFDESLLGREELVERILEIGSKAGFKDSIVFS
ncbi:MAG TPA: hypothetical protein VFF30_01425 [Nitrososphaerales archaeon]|nr:hypothetical protein [Nitrososphaerales archaeon]